MSSRKRFLRGLTAALGLALALPALATRDPEFPPDAIVVLASVDSDGSSMAGKFTGKVDYVCDGTDDQVEIQKAIQQASVTPTSALRAGQGGTVILVGGKFFISDTITITKASAFTIRGLGGRPANGSGSEHTVGYSGWAPNDNNTALIWVGEDGGTMIHLHCILTCTFKNLLLFGRNGAESNTADKLMHVTWEYGWAAGGYRLTNVTFQAADKGLVMGVNDPNYLSCDNVNGEHVSFINLDKGFVLTNNQSLPHSFFDLKSAQCATAVIYIEHGGNISVFGGSDVGSGAYVYIDNAGGINTEPLVFEGIRMQPLSGVDPYTPTFLAGAGGSIMHVVMTGCSVSGGDTSNPEYCLDFGQGISVTARDCVFTGKVANIESTAGNYPASLILDACAVPEPADVTWSNLITLDSSEYCRLDVQNCYNVDSPGQALAYNGLTWPKVNDTVVIWSDVVDARTTQTVSFDVYGKGYGSKDAVFVPTKVGLQVVTLPTGITGAPSFQWGWSGSASGLHSTTIYSVPGVNSIYSAPASASSNMYLGRTDGFTATVSTGATVTSGLPLYVRFFWMGHVQQTN